MDNTAIVCQARLGSSRLPGKVLYSISGINAIELIANRYRVSGINIPLIFAIPDTKQDQALIYELDRLEIDYIVGDESNLVSRYLIAAENFNLERIVRITSDCPLFDFNDLSRQLETSDITTTLTTNSHEYEGRAPDGFDFEIFKTNSLRCLLSEQYLRGDHCEHVTTFWREYKQDKCKFLTNYPAKYENLRFTLDSPEDFLFLSKLFSLIEFSDLKKIDINSLCEIALEDELYKINMNLIRPTAIKKTDKYKCP